MSDIHTAPTRKIRELVRALQPATLVVAGNYVQFQNWRRKDPSRASARYVGEGCRGLFGNGAGTIALFLGTYYERRDLGEITEYVASHPDWTTSFVREGGGLVAK